MLTRLRRRLAAAALVAAVAVPLTAGSGQARAERIPFAESFAFEDDPFVLEACELRVDVVGGFTGWQVVLPDGRVHTHALEHTDWYDAETGQLLLSQRDHETEHATVVSDEIDAQTGLRTVVTDVVVLGVPLRLQRPGDPPAAQDSGRLALSITLVLDPAGDVVDQQVEPVAVAGPHDFFAGGLEEQVAVLCAALQP